MNEALINKTSDALSSLLITTGLQRAALIDDVYDSLELMELPSGERDDLWTLLEDNDAALADLERIGYKLSDPGELTGMVLAAFDASRTQCPAFESVWLASMVGIRVEAGRGQVGRLKELLEKELDLEVGTFGGSSPTEDLVSGDAQLLFIDWCLGDDVVPGGVAGVMSEGGVPTAVEAAITKVASILSMWSDRPKPIFVLMSSHPGLREHAGEFCRHSGILRGMFYAVPKGELTDRFKFRMHMRIFAMSLTAGRDLQAFVDALHKKFDGVKDDFLKRISDLTLNDYAYVQSLSLQDDGQPLGDYLVWLFSAYFGQMLFAEALREQLAALDTVKFTEALPNSEPPSGRLTELYYCALFDTSVEPVGEHPVLSLGDVFGYSIVKGEDGAMSTGEISAVGLVNVSQASEGHNPDLFLVINPQCDLAFTPDHDGRPMDSDRSILLVPGYRQPILAPITDKGAPRTELYRHDGSSYRVVWDPRRVLAVPYGQFATWQQEQGCERMARLRLSSALEVQRAFAADLTRVGMPVMPPIYQQVTARVLHIQDRNFQATNGLRDDEAVFLVLTRDGLKIRQQCVLTLPLVTRLKAMIDERIMLMRTELDAVDVTDRETHLPQQIAAMEKMLANDDEWARLLSPFDLPKPNGSKKFLGDNIQIVQGKKEGDASDSRAIAVVSLDLGDTTS